MSLTTASADSMLDGLARTFPDSVVSVRINDQIVVGLRTMPTARPQSGDGIGRLPGERFTLRLKRGAMAEVPPNRKIEIFENGAWKP
jgi:hypothetical protein